MNVIPFEALLGPKIQRLEAADRRFWETYPGESRHRQPVHTSYGGAHLFRADRAQALGEVALQTFRDYAPNPFVLAKAIELPGADGLPCNSKEQELLRAAFAEDPDAVRQLNPAAWLACTVYQRVARKLVLEPVEDIRIDFEDGYGYRSDEEEDNHALAAAREVAIGLQLGSLPPFLGIRIKPLTQELYARSLRTLKLFIAKLTELSASRLPDNFVVCLPKVLMPEQVSLLADVMDALEHEFGLKAGALKIELLIENPQAIISYDGTSRLPSFIPAGHGRCVSAHFGAFDYTASCSITAEHQKMHHAACSFAKHAMQAAYAGTGIWLADGMTNVLPVPAHRSGKAGAQLEPWQVQENMELVHRCWRLHYQNVRQSLLDGFYQGCDVHPAQFPTRYAAVYAFFLEGLEAAGSRLRRFLDKETHATRSREVMDAIATGQGLLNFFLRALSCAAITEDEAVEHSGLSVDDLRDRSFRNILENRRSGAVSSASTATPADLPRIAAAAGD
jgi:citrate lyase beta subunit